MTSMERLSATDANKQPAVVVEERLKDLDVVEDDIGKCLHSAGTCLAELAKDKPSIKQVEGQANDFLAAVRSIETRLLNQITYLSQIGAGSAHEGSVYKSAQQVESAQRKLQYLNLRLSKHQKLLDSHSSSQSQLPITD